MYGARYNLRGNTQGQMYKIRQGCPVAGKSYLNLGYARSQIAAKAQDKSGFCDFTGDN
jgi:hypothetical protein